MIFGTIVPLVSLLFHVGFQFLELCHQTPTAAQPPDLAGRRHLPCGSDYRIYKDATSP